MFLSAWTTQPAADAHGAVATANPYVIAMQQGPIFSNDGRLFQHPIVDPAQAAPVSSVLYSSLVTGIDALGTGATWAISADRRLYYVQRGTGVLVEVAPISGLPDGFAPLGLSINPVTGGA